MQRTKFLSASYRIEIYAYVFSVSLIDAARRLKKLAAWAIKERQFGAAVSLYIQTTFNSIPWMRILEALANVKVPVYLCDIIRDWVVFAQTASGMVRKEMMCGVPQESVLGPLLWNIAFDNILKEEVLPGVYVICLVVMAENDIPTLERRVNTALEAMTRWIESAGLNLATTKTEVVLFTCRCRFSPPLLPKGGADKTLYSPKVFGFVVRW